MLEDYKEIDQVVYKQMIKSVDSNLSHAYLFNLNDNIYADNMIVAFVKSIICKVHKDKEEYNNCVLCKRIDDENYPDIKKLYPDGMFIKKEQIDELQKKFSSKSLENNKEIYIIYEADRLNTSATNSLLKFLEEPSEGIIAILLTNNINQMLETIISRCQLITFTKNDVNDYINYNKIDKDITLNKLAFSIWKINDTKAIDESVKDFIENVIKFIRKYENEKIKMIIYLKEMFHDKFIELDDISKFFECIILFYRDVVSYQINGQVMYFDDYIDDINKVLAKNNKSRLIHKLNVIIDSEKFLKSNANVPLLMDCMIIDMEEEL